MGKAAFIWHPVFLLLLALSLAYASGAQDVIIKHFTVSDGLPNAAVYGVIQDKKGFMWMCTEAGVSRFDGKQFTNYSLTDGLAENEILSLAQDSKGRIWFLGFNGTLSYCLDGKFFNAGNDPLLKKIPHAGSLLNFFEDKKKRLWFSSLHGYILIDGDSVKYLDKKDGIPFGAGVVMNNSGNIAYITNGTFSADPDKKLSFRCLYPFQQIIACAYLPDSSILYPSATGIVRQKDTLQKLLRIFDTSLASVKINALLISTDGKLWVSTAGKGLFCYDYHDFSKPPKQYLHNMHTARLAEDREGNIWAGTVNEGVYMLQPWYGIARNYNSATGIESDNVFSVAKDSKGNIYAGMDKGKVYLINPAGIRAIQVNKRNLNYNRTIKILTGGEDIFFGSDRGLVYINDIKRMNGYVCFESPESDMSAITAIKDMCFYKNGLAVCSGYAIYIDTIVLNSGSGQSCLQKIDGESLRRYAVFADKNSTLWYSTASGLCSYDGRTAINHTAVNKFISEKISAIGQAADSTLVLATYGHGVLFYKNDKVQAVFTEKNGLANNICRKVFVHNDDIYIATINGLSCVKYANGSVFSIRQFNTGNGLISNDVNDVYADDKDICIATSGGLTVLNASAAHQPAEAPPVYITGVVCNDTLQLSNVSNILSYRQNSFHFEYIGISYRSGTDVHYQYQLNPGQPWMETDNTALDIPFLPPGSYYFLVRARILNGAWSDPKSFLFTIAPPFWRTYPFIIISILFCVAVVSIIVRYIVKREHKKRNEQFRIRNQITNLEQQALQAMMNPHFIFNVMNSIQHYINSNDRHEANLYLSDFAKLIRMNLDISSKRYIPLDSEIEYLSLYLSLERLRFGDRLTYEVNIDPAIDTDETMIPVMLLQPFIENALWHGILPMKGNGHVRLDITRQPGSMLKIEITDNGVGMPATTTGEPTGMKTHTSKGMKMTRQRLDLLGRISGHTLYLNIHDAYPDRENKGTKVELLLPADLV